MAVTYTVTVQHNTDETKSITRTETANRQIDTLGLRDIAQWAGLGFPAAQDVVDGPVRTKTYQHGTMTITTL